MILKFDIEPQLGIKIVLVSHLENLAKVVGLTHSHLYLGGSPLVVEFKKMEVRIICAIYIVYAFDGF